MAGCDAFLSNWCPVYMVDYSVDKDGLDQMNGLSMCPSPWRIFSFLQKEKEWDWQGSHLETCPQYKVASYYKCVPCLFVCLFLFFYFRDLASCPPSLCFFLFPKWTLVMLSDRGYAFTAAPTMGWGSAFPLYCCLTFGAYGNLSTA